MKNKIALVTGGSRGNGRSTVLEFARQNISTFLRIIKIKGKQLK